MEKAGSNISLDTLATGLADRGHDIVIHTTNFAVDNEFDESKPYEVNSIVNKSHLFSSPYNIIKYIKSLETKVDIFHVFAPWLNNFFGYYRYIGGTVPVVGRLNSYTMFCTNPSKMNGSCHKNCSFYNKFKHDRAKRKKKVKKTPFYLFLDLSFPRFSNHVDLYFAQSPIIMEYYNEAGLDESRIKVVSNFPNKSFYDGEKTTPSVGEWDGFNILYVGRIEEEKGVDILVDCSKFLGTNHNIHIVGDGSAMNQIRLAIEKLSTDTNITLHGWTDRDNLPQFYDNSDVFIHPSRWPEPSGRAILEALQYDCPIITSEESGPNWIKGDAGMTFENNDPSDLADKILTVSSDWEKYDQMIEECEDRLTEFNQEKILDKIEDEYEDIIFGDNCS